MMIALSAAWVASAAIIIFIGFQGMDHGGMGGRVRRELLIHLGLFLVFPLYFFAMGAKATLLVVLPLVGLLGLQSGLLVWFLRRTSKQRSRKYIESRDFYPAGETAIQPGFIHWELPLRLESQSFPKLLGKNVLLMALFLIVVTAIGSICMDTPSDKEGNIPAKSIVIGLLSIAAGLLSTLLTFGGWKTVLLDEHEIKFIARFTGREHAFRLDEILFARFYSVRLGTYLEIGLENSREFRRLSISVPPFHGSDQEALREELRLRGLLLREA